MKLTFESGLEAEQDKKAVRALVEKLRARFKVCAAQCKSIEDEGSAAIAITALASTEDKMSKTLDAIVEFCESSGFGRVDTEQTLMDHIDAMVDYEEADEE